MESFFEALRVHVGVRHAAYLCSHRHVGQDAWAALAWLTGKMDARKFEMFGEQILGQVWTRLECNPR